MPDDHSRINFGTTHGVDVIGGRQLVIEKLNSGLRHSSMVVFEYAHTGERVDVNPFSVTVVTNP